MPRKDWRHVVFPIAATALVALGNRFFMDTHSAWYLSLVKPSIQPPPIVFTAIWGASYALIAFSAVLCCMRRRNGDVLLAYAFNGALQMLWTYLFGQTHRLASAMWCLLLLTAETYVLYRLLHKIDRNIAYLLIPYFLWLIFTCSLNYALVMLN